MNISRYFIDRPILASVVSLLIFIAGAIAIFRLPVSEYPNLIPPSVIVTASYPGANSKVIAETIATPLEEQLTGTENMLYMSSQATADGKLTLTATFKVGTNVDVAQQMVQNRVSQALSRLPDITRQRGVTVVKSSQDLTMVVHLTSPNKSYDELYLRNYALLNVKNVLAKVAGVGAVNLYGSGDYAMRIWLNPEQISQRNLTANEVVAAIREQNIQVAAGIIGGAPANNLSNLQLPIDVKGRLQSTQEFGDIIIRIGNTGEITRLKDVARLEMGASEFDLSAMLDNQPAVAMLVFQTPNSNAIDISDAIRATMQELSKRFPPDIEFNVVYDPTTFVKSSINAVIKTLLEALVLVILIVVLFLQNWRASIIPLIAVPVAIIGTFSVMWIFGFSINTLSLFGLILAVGIVVDDAIVVVENVQRHIEDGLSPRSATYKAMTEVSGPIIAISLTLVVIFVPVAFVSGLTGQFYQQFALTIAISTIISAINSLTLSPALASMLLKNHDAPKDRLTVFVDKWLGSFFSRFNTIFSRASGSYSTNVGSLLGHKTMTMSVYLLLLTITIIGFNIVPKGFLPIQDKQYLIAFAQLPSGANLSHTQDVVKQIGDIGLAQPGVEHAVQFPGLSINGFTNSSSAGIVFFPLKAFEERSSEKLSAFAIAQKLQKKFLSIKEAEIVVFPPPPILGLGTTGGFKLQIEDRTGAGYQTLANVTKQIQQKAMAREELFSVYSNYKINTPQLYADVDRTRAKQLGLNLKDLFDTMQIYLGSLYVNDFNQLGRTYQVIVQADAQYRNTPEAALNLKVRNQSGTMVPLASVISLNDSQGPESTSHYNGYLSADINGFAAPGYSTGQAKKVITEILQDTLPPGIEYEWTDLTYQEMLAGNTIVYILPLCIFLVFLVLAAYYENWVLPFVIVLIVPLSILSALFGVIMFDGDNNIFTQVSLFVLAGLACKNAILIVDFAYELEKRGMETYEAAIAASRMRLRPIVMTSFAFIVGTLPMVFSTGAASEMRNSMGVAVFSGMLGVTVFGLIFTPIFYVLCRKFEKKKIMIRIQKVDKSTFATKF